MFIIRPTDEGKVVNQFNESLPGTRILQRHDHRDIKSPRFRAPKKHKHKSPKIRGKRQCTLRRESDQTHLERLGGKGPVGQNFQRVGTKENMGRVYQLGLKIDLRRRETIGQRN